MLCAKSVYVTNGASGVLPPPHTCQHAIHATCSGRLKNHIWAHLCARFNSRGQRSTICKSSRDWRQDSLTEVGCISCKEMASYASTVSSSDVPGLTDKLKKKGKSVTGGTGGELCAILGAYVQWRKKQTNRNCILILDKDPTHTFKVFRNIV